MNYILSNKQMWDYDARNYQREHGSDLSTENPEWAPIASPGERDLRVLGEVHGKDTLELGSGGGQLSIYLSKQGARPVGLDLSIEQLRYARHLMAGEGVAFPLILGNAEDLSFLRDASFDIVTCIYGAVGFVDINHCFPEVYRVLRPGGLFAFSWHSPLFDCLPFEGEDQLRVMRSYFDRSIVWLTEQTPNGQETNQAEFPHSYRDWHHALTRSGFIVTDIIEPQPYPPDSPYYRDSTWKDWASYAKASMVPVATIWRAVKPRVPLGEVLEGTAELWGGRVRHR